MADEDTDDLQARVTHLELDLAAALEEVDRLQNVLFEIQELARKSY